MGAMFVWDANTSVEVEWSQPGTPDWRGKPHFARTIHFAGQHDGCPAVFELRLAWTVAGRPERRPEVFIESHCIEPSGRGDCPTIELEELDQVSFVCRINVPPRQPDELASELLDDQVTILLASASGSEIPRCRIVLRRTKCRVDATLLEAEDPTGMPPQLRAALLWHGWNRYSETVGLRYFRSGRSGAKVLVVQPRLSDPVKSEDHLPAALPGVVQSAWGAPLLVKHGPADILNEEWNRYHTYVADRAHPFMARSEAFLSVRAAAGGDSQNDRATLIGSFLGGELMQIVTFEQMLNGPSGSAECLRALDQLIRVLGFWYKGSANAPLWRWETVFGVSQVPRDDGTPPGQFFGRFDFANKVDRARYVAGVFHADVDFICSEHLHGHLLGNGPDRIGLLPQLSNWNVRYSLIHGDLQPRNVLAGGDNIWMIDFGNAGIAPTLADFAKLEVFIRLWGLELRNYASCDESACEDFERHLLDDMAVSNASVGSIRQLAPRLGAEPDHLVKIAGCINLVRERAMNYESGRPDRRDYLAVLYLTTLDSMRYAVNEPDLTPNYRLLMALIWQTEDLLSRMAGMQPFARRRRVLDRTRLLSAQWLAAPSAPGRVAYLLNLPEGRNVLAPLAATRGVTQSAYHHLDVFDHTLLVLANLEEILVDPVRAMSNPADFCERVRFALDQQRLALNHLGHIPQDSTMPDIAAMGSQLAIIAGALERRLDPHTRIILKWAALLHDIGKPSTRVLTMTSDASKNSVAFPVHEVRGMHLAGPIVENLLGELDRKILAWLIRKHHMHHHLVSHFFDPARLQRLRATVAMTDPNTDEYHHIARSIDENSGFGDLFPLLILHGFADMAACRGPDNKLKMSIVAEIDLLILAVWAERQKFETKASSAERVEELLERSGRELGWPLHWLGEVRSAFHASFLGRTSDTIEGQRYLLGQLSSPRPNWMRENYQIGDTARVSAILAANSERLSRTCNGKSETSTSVLKKPLRLCGKELSERAAANESRVAELIMHLRSEPQPKHPGVLKTWLLAVADTVNDGLLPGPERFRQWDCRTVSDKNQKPPPKVPHLDLPAKFDEFVKELFERWPSLMDNAVRIAAWAEWELNLGPLHPFYDGCGRISRAFAALLLIRANWKLPVYSSWDEYCCAGQEGVEAFIEYVWERLRWGTVDNY